LGLASLLMISACGQDRPADSSETGPAAAQAQSVIDTARKPAARLMPGTEKTVEPTGEYPFEDFDIPDDEAVGMPIVRYPLRIENGTIWRIVVAATAGAGSVILDSLDPGADIRIDLEAPADGLVLSWKTTVGNTSGLRPVRVVADSVQLVRIEALSEPR